MGSNHHAGKNVMKLIFVVLLVDVAVAIYGKLLRNGQTPFCIRKVDIVPTRQPVVVLLLVVHQVTLMCSWVVQR